MAELPIHPERGPEAPGYGLERRRKRLSESHAASFPGAKEELRRRSVRETLLLTGHPIESEEVDLVAAAESDPVIQGLFDALDLLEREAGAKQEPDLSLLQELHRLTQPEADGTFRRGERPPQFAAGRNVSTAPQFVEAKLSNLAGWLASESARSMFPAERMTLFFARFLEVAPFDRGNFRTGHVAVNLFAAAAGFPPVTLLFAEADGIRSDVENAMQFQTEPLVLRFSEAIARSLAVWERHAGVAT